MFLAVSIYLCIQETHTDVCIYIYMYDASIHIFIMCINYIPEIPEVAGATKKPISSTSAGGEDLTAHLCWMRLG